MKNLPPLEVGQAYRAQDFERFEYDHLFQGEQKAILRLHLKNATTIDIPTNDAELKRLMHVLISSFGEDAVAFLREMKWV